MNMDALFTIEDRHSSGLYPKQPIQIVRGSGALLWDAEGLAYLDCTSGHGVANLGHAHPKVAAAIAAQAAAAGNLFETFYNDQRAALMESLTALTPGLERVFFCNSGTETIEAAIKFARLSTGRSGIIAAMRGFHGRTLGALSATWNKKYRQPFEPLVPGFSHVPYNNIEALEQAVNEETAAVLLEVVQGEGGVYPANPEYLQAARRICTQSGALLIIDEVQTGFGRTGKMFAYQHSEVVPDLLCVAKSLAGGLPMGAVLIGPAVQNLAPGLHGSTFGGNPLACAAALATLGSAAKRTSGRPGGRKRRLPDGKAALDPLAAGARSARPGADGGGRAQAKSRPVSAPLARAAHPGAQRRAEHAAPAPAAGDHV